jgi:hypothetical protein
MWHPARSQWTVIWAATVLLLLAWPPSEGKSLGVKALNWIADPADSLPVPPPTLPMGLDDDGDAVAAHDAQEQEYYRVYQSSSSARVRMDLKIAADPLQPTSERQLLVALGVVAALGVWQLEGRKKKTPGHF